MAYIDTSVLVAYYCLEPLSAKAQRAISEDDVPSISPLVEVEFYSTVATKVRTGELGAADANRVLRLLSDHLADGVYRQVAIASAEYGLARDWLSRFSTTLRSLDALHLAAASCNQMPLVTADRGLARSAEQLGVKVQLVR